MTRTHLLFALLLALAVAACGKDKKKTTTPDTGTEGTATEETTTDGDTSEATAGDNTGGEERPAFGPIYFEFDSDAIMPESRTTLENVAAWMTKHPESHLTLEGHADEQGADEYNVALGDRRARAARDFLIRMGVEEGRIRVVSYGEARPAAEGDDAKNRRDEFILKYGDKPKE